MHFKSNVVPMRTTPVTAALSKLREGYEARGMQDGNLVIHFPLQERTVKVPPASLTPKYLLAACGVEYTKTHYMRVSLISRQESIDYDQLVEDIIAACHKKGRYVDALERGLGVFQTENGQDVVVNGTTVFHGVAGTEVVDGAEGGVCYNRGKVLDMGPTDPVATPVDVTEVGTAFGAPRWTWSMAPMLLLGWLFVATLSGALRNRPHLWISGPAAAGKSTLANLISWLLGSSGFSATGAVNGPGMYQALKNHAGGFLLDETEVDGKGGTAALLDIARSAYSLQEGDAGIMRGTSSGTPKYYRTLVTVCAFGINKPGMREADSGRWVSLTLRACVKHGPMQRLFVDEAYARAVGRRVRRLAVKRWGVFQQALPAFQEGIRRSGGGTRQQVGLGTLLAGYWSLTQSVAPTMADVDQLTASEAMMSHLADVGDTDEQQCLSRFLSYRFAVSSDVQERFGTRSASLSNAVAFYLREPDLRDQLDAPLQDLGVRVLGKDGDWKIAVPVSATHRELAKIFAGTPWRGGAWTETFLRLPGGEKAQVRIGGRSIKAVMFDVPAELCEEQEVPGTVTETDI